MNIQKLWNEFDNQPMIIQVEILKEYCIYVAQYPDEHGEGNYPASFLEWWTNDYQDALDEMKGKI